MGRRTVSVHESVQQVVERLALRLAEQHQGCITVNHLVPYLPMSLGLMRTCLETLVDESAVWSRTREDLRTYEFAAYQGAAGSAALRHDTCVTCGTVTVGERPGLCALCLAAFVEVLRTYGPQTDWPLQALWEHEILYVAAQAPARLPAESLASRSSLSLRRMRQYLQALSLDGCVSREVESGTGVVTHTFPALVYPRTLYQHNLVLLRTLASAGTAARRRRGRWLVLCLGALGLGSVLLGQLIGFLPLWPGATPSRPRLVPLQQDVVPPPAVEPVTVRIAIRQDGFRATGLHVAAQSHRPIRLMDTPPPGLVQEPRYEGERQQYGSLFLGSNEPKRFLFVLDVLSQGRPVLYVDLNQNGNLADDGLPLSNQGTGFFATTVRIPLARLLPGGAWPGHYEAWFVSNARLWRQGLVTYYSRTQFQGTVTVAGHTYTAYLADDTDNDADFTNNGLHLDLDGDGKITPQSESFPPGGPVRIGAVQYRFEIAW